MNILKQHYLKFLLVALIALTVMVVPLLAQDTAPNAPCQAYRLTVAQGRVRSQPRDDAPVIGGANRSETLCIQGVAEGNAEWLIIKLEDDDNGFRQGYINSSIVEPGMPGQLTNPGAFCDAYRVIPDTAIVRAGPSTSYAILDTFSADDRLCVEDYLYLYNGWISISQPGTGTSGWVSGENLTYRYNESLGCPDGNSAVVTSTTDLYTCAGLGCNSGNSLASNAQVCVLEESEESRTWVTFPVLDGRTGWMVLDLLQPIDGEVTVSDIATSAPVDGTPSTDGTQSAEVAIPLEDCIAYRVDSPSAARVRSQPSTNSTQIGSLEPETIVCVLGVAETSNDWLRLNLAPGSPQAQIGFVFASLLEPLQPQSQNTTVENIIPTSTPVLEGTTVAQDATPAATQTPFVPPPEGVQICPIGAVPVNPGECITVTPTTIIGAPELVGNGLSLARDVTLSSLFVPNINLVSPESSVSFFFRLPEDWVVGTPTTLFLTMDYNEAVIASALDVETSGLSTRFDVRVDDTLVSTITFNADNIGRQTIQIPIPDSVLANPEARFHTVEFNLAARDYCRVNTEARLAIDALESAIRFTYQEAQPFLDFTYYPIPFFNNPIGNEIETVIFVLPENPSDSDLQAAASVAGGFGKLSGNSVNIRFELDNTLSNEDYRNHNLVLVGTITDNTRINDVYRRGATSSQWNVNTLIVDNQQVAVDDGLIEMLVNPDNPNRAILLITGQSGTAVELSGQALGGRPSIMSLTGKTAVIFESRSLAHGTDFDSDTIPGTYTIADMNNGEDVVLSGLGLQVAELDFDVPLGGDVRPDAYMEIIYNNSSILDDANAALNIAINGVPVASSILQRNVTQIQTDNTFITAEGFRTLRIAIPEGTILPGQRNTLTLYADMEGDWGCDIPDGDSIWVTVSKESKLFLPQSAIDPNDTFPLVVQFPLPFNIIPDMGDVLISVPEVITEVEGEQMLRIVSNIADATRFGEGFRPLVLRGDIPDDFPLEDYHMIVLGRPSTNGFLQQLNVGRSEDEDGNPISPPQPYLPQPFLTGTDEIIQIYDDVSYRLRNRAAVGVIQTFDSPWNELRRVLVITGTEPLGQISATNALLNLSFGTIQLQGDVVFTTMGDAYPVDTRNIFDPREILFYAANVVADTSVDVDTPTPLFVGTSTQIPMTETPLTPSDIIVTLSPAPTLQPTRIPTLTVLTPIATDEPTEGPDIMLIVIGISVAVVIIGGIYTLFTELRPKKTTSHDEDDI